ncbi:type 1 periplasmic binding fold superfamily protein [Wenyingzhuangia sp. IMCC45533]
MKLKHLFLSAFLGLAIVSCKKDDPEEFSEPELITTLNYTLTPQGGGAVVKLKYFDADGEGTAEPVITDGSLVAGITYDGVITVLNETEDPAEDITEEIASDEGKLEHQFFFTPPSGSKVEYADTDSEGKPVGLSTTLTTLDTYSGGDLEIILIHEPNKSAEGVAENDITNAGGEADITVDFNLGLDPNNNLIQELR